MRQGTRCSTQTVKPVTSYADAVREALVTIAKVGADLSDTAAIAHARWLLDGSGAGGANASTVGLAMRLSPRDCSVLVIAWATHILFDVLERGARTGTTIASLNNPLRMGHYVDRDLEAIGMATGAKFLTSITEQWAIERKAD